MLQAEEFRTNHESAIHDPGDYGATEVAQEEPVGEQLSYTPGANNSSFRTCEANPL